MAEDTAAASMSPTRLHTMEVSVAHPATTKAIIMHLFTMALTSSDPHITRYFRSPPLEPGNYSYQIHVAWTENGKKVSKAETVHVGPGGQSMVNFFSGKT